MQLPSDYDQIYVVSYPVGTGGNFLINCLAMNDQCVFLSAPLAWKQLEGEFDPKQKMIYLRDKLYQARMTKKWNDLDLGNGQFYGQSHWLNDFPELIGLRLDPIVNTLVNQRKKFFFIHHDLASLDRITQIWTHAKIIIFTQYRQFLQWRDYGKATSLDAKAIHYWNTVRAEGWPEHPPTTQGEFDLLPLHLQQELKGFFNFEISRWFNYDREFDHLWSLAAGKWQEKKPADVYLWPVDQAYASAQNLVNSLESLIQYFDLPLIDAQDVKTYFEDWKTTLDAIKT